MRKKFLFLLLLGIYGNSQAIDLQSLKDSQSYNSNINNIKTNSNTPAISGTSSNYNDNTVSSNNSPISELNELRSRYNLDDLQEDNNLDTAAYNHTYYLEDKNIPSHEEEQSDPRFTGVSPMDRSVKAGYVGRTGKYSVGEVISFYDGEHQDDIDNFLVAIFHRFIILDPRYDNIGYYYSDKNNTNIIEIMLGTKTANHQVTYTNYPYDSQSNVPTTFYPKQELPDPMPGYTEVGYPISFQITGGNSLSVSSFSLTDSQGNNIEGKSLLPGSSDEVQSSEFGFIPLSPLKENQAYQVSISGLINGNSFNKSWTFYTGVAAKPEVYTDKDTYRPNENFNLYYKNINADQISFKASTIGSYNNLIKVNSQEWGKINIQALSGCQIASGCQVTMSIVAGNQVYKKNIIVTQ